MGAKTWMLMYADADARRALACRPQLDRAQSEKLARTLFPGERLESLEDGTLQQTSPPDDELCVGSFPGVSIVAAREFGIDRPSELTERFISEGGNGTITLHAMHSVVDWFAFAQWSKGKLMRSLSLSPDNGVMEDIGSRLPFEEPFWAGEFPAVEEGDDEDYPLPFHPLELGEAALSTLFGYYIEGTRAAATPLFDPESLPLMRYKRSRSRWKFWR